MLMLPPSGDTLEEFTILSSVAGELPTLAVHEKMKAPEGFSLARTKGFPYNLLSFLVPMFPAGEAVPDWQLFPTRKNAPGGSESMIRKSIVAKGLLLTTLVFLAGLAQPAVAQAQGQSGQPSYTIPEYNAFEAANAEKDPATQVKLLDDFVAKYPNSTLLPYVYQLYYPAYAKLKNYAKEIEYADKVIALGDKVDTSVKLPAIQARLLAFSQVFNPKAPDAHDQLVKQRDAADLGVKLLIAMPKPANMASKTDAEWENDKKPALALFSGLAGAADVSLKDYAAAIPEFKSSLANKPDDAVTTYQLGVSYLQTAPPQYLDGFWMLARAINLKIPGDAKVKDYLKKQILAYEQPGCDGSADAQLNELLQLAGTSGERPATYTIPSAADLTQIRQSSNILSLISDLSAGGDKAKMTWLALCGAQFPEVVGKIIDVKPGDNFVDFLVYTGATDDDIQKATTANMDVKVQTAAPAGGATPAPAASATGGSPPPGPQPDVVRLQKDDGIRFAGTVSSYDPNPFLLYWTDVKVDPTVIPEKEEQGKHHKVPTKRSGN
jgi:tetratricopeptide (TPR) repeat protein